MNRSSQSPAFFGTLDALGIAWFFDENDELVIEEELPAFISDMVDTYDDDLIHEFQGDSRA